MTKSIYIAVIILCFCFHTTNLFSQNFTDSNLPIVVITTDNDPNTGLPLAIPDEPKVLGTMKIIARPNGARNYLTDSSTPEYLNYDGRIGIEIRGSSSQALPKKAYSFTTLIAGSTSTATTQNVSLLGMPAENDWILNSLAFDQSLLRDNLSYYLARQIGNYAVRTTYCEVVVNGTYVGLYMLTEKIKADSNRVNIVKITATNTTLPNVTGGYITKADKPDVDEPIAWTNTSYDGQTVDYIHELPKPEAAVAQQTVYINGVFNDLATTAASYNASIINGYPSIIDVPTFVDFMLLNELAANVDGYQFSTFFHKDRNGKLRAGPIWDFNLTFGNDLFMWGYFRSLSDKWHFNYAGNNGSKFWKDLFDEFTFKCYLSRRWNQLIQPGKPFNQSEIYSFIDTVGALIQEAITREHQKWGTIPNYNLEIQNMKSWISNRINWITSNIGGFSNCSNVTVPQLVISQINYNPVAMTTPAVYSSNNQEFIQITNNSTSTVNLTGYYFSELGISYQFPPNSFIEAGKSIYLASNMAVFQSRYGLTAFGQFTRNLSNTSQKLVLVDAFGNEIDRVEYFDTAPWPTTADGGGSYLQLINLNMDNNVGSNWTCCQN